MTHRSSRVSEVYPELSHGSDDGHQTLDGVAVDHRLVLETFLLTVASLVDDLHLLHNGALPGLSSAWKENKVLVDEIWLDGRK